MAENIKFDYKENRSQTEHIPYTPLFNYSGNNGIPEYVRNIRIILKYNDNPEIIRLWVNRFLDRINAISEGKDWVTQEHELCKND